MAKLGLKMRVAAIGLPIAALFGMLNQKFDWIGTDDPGSAQRSVSMAADGRRAGIELRDAIGSDTCEVIVKTNSDDGFHHVRLEGVPGKPSPRSGTNTVESHARYTLEHRGEVNEVRTSAVKVVADAWSGTKTETYASEHFTMDTQRRDDGSEWARIGTSGAPATDDDWVQCKSMQDVIRTNGVRGLGI